MTLPGTTRQARTDALEGQDPVQAERDTSEGLPERRFLEELTEDVDVDDDVDRRSALRKQIDAYLVEDKRPRITDEQWLLALEHCITAQLSPTSAMGALFRSCAARQDIDRGAEAELARSEEIRASIRKPPAAEDENAPGHPAMTCPVCGGEAITFEKAAGGRRKCFEEHVWRWVDGEAQVIA